jgi:transcription antitermination protein NusB
MMGSMLREATSSHRTDGVMDPRSRAREVALQLLYQRDLNPRVPRDAIERFVRERLKNPTAQTFCLGVFDGAVEKAEEIDRGITEAAQNWRLTRMTVVDRNVLRLGAYELLFSPQTPVSVVLNEAIELARRYGSANSPGFVNGVLDRIRARAAAPSA